ncbi:hypothetical protein AHAS_Ahas05G0156000 [Arachis hypogaea]
MKGPYVIFCDRIQMTDVAGKFLHGVLDILLARLVQETFSFQEEVAATMPFYNWNIIKVRYCDGSLFTGDIEAVDPKTNLHYRGGRNFVAIFEDLLAKGMRNAQNAILSGCSAGGLTAILQCDRFRSLILAGAKAKCISDACYFINVKDVSGAQHIQEFYSQVVVTHVFFLICFRLQGKRNNKVRSCQRSLLRYTNLKGTIY